MLWKWRVGDVVEKVEWSGADWKKRVRAGSN
jgi:hypothetical protein